MYFTRSSWNVQLPIWGNKISGLYKMYFTRSTHALCAWNFDSIFFFQVTEQSQLVVATNADAEVTERAVPGESPSNVQLPPMAVPSPFTDNASTLASLRMVSYLEGFRLMYPPPFLHVHFSSHYLQNPSSFLCPWEG
jgi:hypothetical protein